MGPTLVDKKVDPRKLEILKRLRSTLDESPTLVSNSSKRGTCRFDRDLFNPRKTYLVLALLNDFVVVICRKVYYCGGKLYCSHLIPSLRICPSLGTRVFEEIKVLTLIRLTIIVEIRFERIERSGLIEKNLDDNILFFLE